MATEDHDFEEINYLTLKERNSWNKKVQDCRPIINRRLSEFFGDLQTRTGHEQQCNHKKNLQKSYLEHDSSSLVHS
jgi:hypothetical protein